MLRSSSNRGTAANVGAAPRTRLVSSVSGGGVDFEDRYRRTAEENIQLKKERNDLEEKLKECKTKLRRLTRDLVGGGAGGGEFLGGVAAQDDGGQIGGPSTGANNANNKSFTGGPSSPNGGRLNTSSAAAAAAAHNRSTSSRAAGGNVSKAGGAGGAAAAASFHQPPHIGPSFNTIQASLWEQEKRRLEESLRRAKAQIEYMQTEIVRLNSAQPAEAQSASALASQLQLLHQQLENARTTKVSDEQRVAELQRERDVVHSDLGTIAARLRESDAARAELQRQLTAAMAALAEQQQQLLQHQQVAGGSPTTVAAVPSAVELGADHYRRQVTELLTQLQAMRDKQLEDQHTIDVLTRERDSAKARLGRAEAAVAGQGVDLTGATLGGGTAAASANNTSASSSNAAMPFTPASLLELQRALAEKSAQILVLTNQMNFAQSRAEATKAESDRVLEDLKSVHLQHAEAKRNMFQLEHERASLLLRVEKVPTLEATIELKTQELLKSEQELLRCIDRLQSCGRETEAQVRRELGDRMAELEAMRDKAEGERRANERDVLALRIELSDAKRRLEGALHDTELYKREAERLEGEKKEMADRVALANVTGGLLSATSFAASGGGVADASIAGSVTGALGLPIGLDDDVSRAVALAAMRKRAAQNQQHLSSTSAAAGSPASPLGRGQHHQSAAGVGLASMVGIGGIGGGGTANEVMAMWEGMEWSDGKELSLLRETLAATAVDMELAEARCVQLQQAVADKAKLLDGISVERDELLNENIELRHRISGVQTALARSHLQKMSAASSSSALGTKTSLVIALNSITCNPIFQQRDDGSTYTPTLFFSLELEGLGGSTTDAGGRRHLYEPVLSETFYSLNSTLSVRFVFENIDTADINFTNIQKTSFVLQLHQSFGTESEIVACASLSGARLLHCRYDGVHSDSLQLLSLEGEAMGSVGVTVTAPDLLLPILLARPLVTAVTSDTIRAALIAFRSVRALRIQVYGASDLLCAPSAVAGAPRRLPSPYVFYTSTSPHGITFIAETMVSTAGRVATADPTFDLLPVDHPVVLDAEFVRFMNDGSLSFVVFDHTAADVQSNLGIAVIRLEEMLASPSFVMQKRLPLHPQGSLEVGISWVRGPE